MRVVEEEIGIGNGRHAERQVAVVEQPRRPVSLHVTKLVMAAMRQQKHAMLLPLEALSRAAVVIPDGGEAPSLRYVDDFVEGELEGWDCLSCGDFSHSRGTHPFLPCQLDESRHAATFLPPPEFQLSQVFHIVASADRYAGGFHPVVVGENFAVHCALRLKRSLCHRYSL